MTAQAPGHQAGDQRGRDLHGAPPRSV